MIKEIHSVKEFMAEEDLVLEMKNYFSVEDTDEVVCYLATGIGAYVGGLPIRWKSYYSFYSYGLMALVKREKKDSSCFHMPKWSTISVARDRSIDVYDENENLIFESTLHLQDRRTKTGVYEVPCARKKDFKAAIVPLQAATSHGVKIKGVFQSNEYRKLNSARGYSMSSRGGMFAVIAAKRLPQDQLDSGRIPVYTLKPGAEIQTAKAMGNDLIYVVNPNENGYLTDIIDVFMSD